MGKTALVVGGTSGIGHGIAVSLARAGHSVTIAGRSAEAGKKIVQEMKEAAPAGTGSFSFEPVDCFDLSSVASLASKTSSLDSLVLTQGMATIQGNTPTKDGFDQKMQLHVHSRMLLASMLSPKLALSNDGGRVLSVLSAGVHGSYNHFSDDPGLEKNYSVKNVADAAGFYNDIYLDSLASLNPLVAYAHAAPGFVSTAWGTEMPTPIRLLIRPLQRLFGKDKFVCGDDLVRNLFDLPAGKLSLISPDGKVGVAKLAAKHEEAKEDVWKHLSEALAQWN